MKHIKLSTAQDLQIYLSDFYNQIVYDGSPEFKEYVPKGIWFTLYQEDAIAGLINLEPLNNVMWIAHVMIYETFRGNKSEKWAIQVADYMKENLETKKILAITPYQSAKKYAERAGFEYLTTLRSSIKKNGELLDQYVLELSV